MIESSDFARLAALTFLEILLSADNALVLALLTHSLPSDLRRKALTYGIAGAVLFRAIAILSVSLLLQYRWLQLFGAAYLIYLSVRHFLKNRKHSYLPSPPHSFWKTVLLIELFDIAFAIDSIIAGVAFISNNHSKLWIVYIGGVLGLLAIRYAATLFGRLLDRFPGLSTSAYLMIGWIGLKLCATVLFPTLPFAPIFWIVLALLFLIGFYKK